MFAFQSYNKLIYNDESFFYSKGMIGYRFRYTGNIVGIKVKFYFTPSLMDVAETKDVPLYGVRFYITDSINSVKLKYRANDVC